MKRRIRGGRRVAGGISGRGHQAWAVAVGAAFAAGQARADIVFGLNSSGAGGIYSLNTTTKTSTLYRSTPIGLTKGNGLAYDSANDTFYYVSRVGTQNFLIRNQPGSVETNLGIMATVGVINSGTFHNGMYWAQRNSAAAIIRVTPGVSSFSEVTTPIPGYPPNVSYGDIASDATGMTWASQSSGMRRYSLNSLGSGSVSITTNSVLRQLAFGPTGLWGVSGTQLFLINTGSGVAVSHGALLTPGLGFVDLATAPAPGAALLLGAGAVLAVRRRR